MHTKAAWMYLLINLTHNIIDVDEYMNKIEEYIKVLNIYHPIVYITSITLFILMYHSIIAAT